MSHLARIKAVNAKYNIFTSIAANLHPLPGNGPLANTTSAIKDNFTTKDLPTTCSSKILEHYVSPFESTVTKLLRDAGTAIVGKTNMDEFGMGNSTTNSFYGPTLNPLYTQSQPLVSEYKEVNFWTPKSAGNAINTDLSFTEPADAQNFHHHSYLQPVLREEYNIDDEMRVVGGSSGGSAAAVASGLVDFAIGSDTGGSVRLPAAYTSIVGFKPTYGRISRWGLIAYAQSLDTVGIMAKDLDVLERVFKVLDHHDENDPTSLGLDNRNTHNKLPKKVKIGVPIELETGKLSPEIYQSWLQLLQTLVDKNIAEVYPVSVPSIHNSLPAYYTLVSSEAFSNLSRFDGIRYGYRSGQYTDTQPEFANTRSLGFGQEVKRRITLGAFSLSSYGYNSHFIKATSVRSRLIQELNAVFSDINPLDGYTSHDGVDFVILPTAAQPAPLVSEYRALKPVDSYLNDVLTVPFSLAGLPTLSVPLGSSSVGMQIAGQFGSDYKLLEFARLVRESCT